MSFSRGIVRVRTRRSVSAKSSETGVTKYEVVNADVVEGVTPSEDGSVVVKIRRGSLDLPAPQTPEVNVTSGALALG